MSLLNFLSGATAFGFAMASLFFLRFWRRMEDALFLYFAIAFALLAVGQVVVTFSVAYFEETAWAYLFRLAAFGVILFAIAGKNRRAQ